MCRMKEFQLIIESTDANNILLFLLLKSPYSAPFPCDGVSWIYGPFDKIFTEFDPIFVFSFLGYSSGAINDGV